MKKVITLTALGTILMASNAIAAGFHLREQSASAQGNSFAGATAGAENNSYTYYNAAGLTRHKGTQVNLGATYIVPQAEAQNVRDANGNRDADVQNVVHAAISPNGTVSYQLNDKTFLGVALNTPYGMITKYDKDWVGGDHGLTSDLKSATITPMIAYKVNNKLSLGAGVQMQYVWAHLTSSNKQTGTDIVSTDGDALDFGYQLGALYEFNEKTRIGLGFRSQIRHKLNGEIKSSGSQLPPPYAGVIDAKLNQDITAKLTTPAMLSMGIYHELNDKWAVMAEYQRVFWSSFKNLTFVSQDSGETISRVNENWRDTNFYALGANYQIDNQWKLRFGIAYDQSAVRLKHRTPRIPDSDRIWYSAGLGYKYSENLSFDAGFTYIQAHSAHINTAYNGNSGRNVSADYSNSVKVFALSLNYTF